MSEIEFKIVSARNDRERVQEANNKVRFEWPEFMLHDDASALFPQLYERVPDCQFVVVDRNTGETLAIGNSIPIQWLEPIEALPDTGWDWAIRRGVDDHEHGQSVNLLCALQIVVFSQFRGKGISRHGVQAMRQISSDLGLEKLIAPVRPSAKSEHPEVPIGEYITWTDKNGLPRDPWLRVHARAGALIVKPCEKAMKITGSSDDWHQWTGMTFDRSGSYIVPGALVPVAYDADTDMAHYIEPNVWMVHSPFDSE